MILLDIFSTALNVWEHKGNKLIIYITAVLVAAILRSQGSLSGSSNRRQSEVKEDNVFEEMGFVILISRTKCSEKKKACSLKKNSRFYSFYCRTCAII